MHSEFLLFGFESRKHFSKTFGKVFEFELNNPVTETQNNSAKSPDESLSLTFSHSVADRVSEFGNELLLKFLLQKLCSDVQSCYPNVLRRLPAL